MCADTDGGDGTGADDGSRMLCCGIHPYGAAQVQGCPHQCHPGMDIRHNGNLGDDSPRDVVPLGNSEDAWFVRGPAAIGA